jgi:isochorismate hydrolase
MARLHRDNALLIVIDVQEKLTAVIHEQEQLQRNIERLVRGCHILKVPAILTEQYPKGLGPTTESVQGAFDQTYGTQAVQKMCFSGYRCSEFVETIKPTNRKQILVAGIEAHVCVYQTVSDLLAEGYDVTVIADAVSSRTALNREIALRRMTQEGARWSSTEMALFELTTEAGTDEFKAISKLVK